MNPRQPTDRITVALADDHTLFREGVREMLATDPTIKIVGEAADGHAAAELAIKHRPDVLLLDVEMPGPGAPSVIRGVNQNCPSVHIIVLTMHDDANMVQNLLDCGATAYLVKSILRDELVTVIHSVARRPGAVIVSVSRQSVEFMGGNRNTRTKSLTKRESEVLQLIVEAFSNAQIAASLRITEATVKRHVTNIYAKLNAVSRVDAIRKATEAGLILPSPGQPRRRPRSLVSEPGHVGRAAAARVEKIVDTAAIRHNVEVLRKAGGGRRIVAVVKGDAYGTGAPGVSRVLADTGVDALGVDTVAEGIELREHGVTGPVIIMDAECDENASACVSYRLTPAVASIAQIRRYASVARDGRATAVWLRTNIGFDCFGPHDEAGFDAVLAELANTADLLRVNGIFGHLSSAASDPGETAAQAYLFHKRAEKARRIFGKGCETSLAATHGLLYPEALGGTGWIRPGLGLFGLVSPASRQLPSWPQAGLEDLRPAITVRARILEIVEMPGDEGVRYSNGLRPSSRTHLASVAIGLACGLPTAGSRLTATLRGVRCPVVGRPGMGCTQFDVTSVPAARPGHWMTFIGPPGGDSDVTKSAEETAGELNLSLYELLATFRAPVRLT